MTFIPVKLPTFLKVLLPGYIWHFSRSEQTLYLTFDDGPIPEITEWVLDQLNKYQAKATFFCIGDNVKKHPQIFERILSEGHTIGNHTYNHLKAWHTSSQKYLDNTLKAEATFSKHPLFSNQKSKLYRPPYGQISMSKTKLLKQEGYKIIMWDVLAMDWQHDVSKLQCAKNVISNVKNGSIVVFHDSLKANNNMKYALSETLKHFSKQGFKFKSIPNT
jgi:peptidoglycan/xylan/chitin deacetylase (PgdA/CDA1 family)